LSLPTQQPLRRRSGCCVGKDNASHNATSIGDLRGTGYLILGKQGAGYSQ